MDFRKLFTLCVGFDIPGRILVTPAQRLDAHSISGWRCAFPGGWAVVCDWGEAWSGGCRGCVDAVVHRPDVALGLVGYLFDLVAQLLDSHRADLGTQTCSLQCRDLGFLGGDQGFCHTDRDGDLHFGHHHGLGDHSRFATGFPECGRQICGHSADLESYLHLLLKAFW
ncbi:hypothetical protein [Mycobacterium sp. smrl_JER01]|uniref:hypothetical protein n=1 Tax=Mycobacterium sp. smrl_JER01 TaxID=3402633 RepID=UPI003D71249E